MTSWASAGFSPVRRSRSFDEVVRQIEEAIASGRYATGDRLPNERALCQALGVSRSTLREALRALEALGIIEVRLGTTGGIFVSTPDARQIGKALEALMRFRRATARELAEFRTSFEGETSHFAALRAEDSDQERLDELVAAARATAARADSTWEQIVDIDVQFHEAVAAASKNEVRLGIMQGIYRALHRVIVSIAPLADDELRRSVGDELSAIAEAIRDGDGDRARAAMRDHVEKFGRLEVSVQESEEGLGRA